jgi:hypothetical protein
VGGQDRTELSALRQSLSKDPALRYSEEFLQWLHSHVISADDWPEAIPAHQVDSVVRLAKECSQAWWQFAQELERRELSGVILM